MKDYDDIRKNIKKLEAKRDTINNNINELLEDKHKYKALIEDGKNFYEQLYGVNKKLNNLREKKSGIIKQLNSLHYQLVSMGY